MHTMHVMQCAVFSAKNMVDFFFFITVPHNSKSYKVFLCMEGPSLM